MRLPSKVEFVLERLEERGYPAYVVGGCVRDRILGRAVHDWDICTAALPEQVREIFADRKVILTGAAHGTVTVVVDGTPLEVTTFRREGSYADHRHPDRVTFVPDLREDLSRRDFTINAMAYAPRRGLVDEFGGQQDLRRGRICCVGKPEDRFEEDALRILRALRFASQLDFKIEEQTAAAALEKRELLTRVSAERVCAEMTALLCGPGAGRVLQSWPQIFGVILPEILPCVGFDQHSVHHQYDVWTHICVALAASPPDPVLRWTLLLHDISKPGLLSFDEKGGGHFYGHPRASARMARQILARLRMDRAHSERICNLVAHHDDRLPTSVRSVRRMIGRAGVEQLRQLCEVKRCDLAAHAATERMHGYCRELEQFSALVEQELASGSCCTLRQLAVNGRDLIELGLQPGPQIGRTLRALLDGVIDEEWPNEKAVLLQRAELLRRAGSLPGGRRSRRRR